MSKIRVMIVDDAVVIRRIVAEVLASDPDIEVAGTAANGKIALAKIPQVNPDLITLDVEMPDMDGVATLRELRRTHPKIPVIMFSTLTARGAASTLDALAAGANDYVTKPANVGSVAIAMARIREELIPKIKGLCHKPTLDVPANLPVRTSNPIAPRVAGAGGSEMVVIGVSTGGPNALADIIPALPGNLPVPVLIVQHMPPVFTKMLAERFDQKSQIAVKEAVHGEVIRPGTVYLAPGDFHMTIDANPRGDRIRLNQEPPENSCRPAVDVLFRSAARRHGGKTLAVILTGMGQDGLLGSREIHDAGGQVVVQDEATSIVWGMPGFVARAGLAEKMLPMPAVAPEIARRVMMGRRSNTAA